MELRLKTLLPAMYADCEQVVKPVSMGSAGLQFGSRWRGGVGQDLGELLRSGHGWGAAASRGLLLEPGAASDDCCGSWAVWAGCG